MFCLDLYFVFKLCSCKFCFETAVLLLVLANYLARLCRIRAGDAEVPFCSLHISRFVHYMHYTDSQGWDVGDCSAWARLIETPFNAMFDREGFLAGLQ